MEKQGEVYHYTGQCPVDLDVFVAEPAASEPETGKYGHRQEPYRRLTGFDPKYFPGGKLGEEQLLLRMKQAPGQGYLTVLYPRLKEDDPPARFTRLSSSAVQVTTALSTDTIFMQAYQDSWTFDGGSYQGQAGVVRRYADGHMTLTHSGGPGKFTLGEQTYEGPKPFVITIKDGQATQTQYEPQLPAP
jgi:hypothetical protein